MPVTTELKTIAADRGTIVISGAFFDEDGAPVTPNSAAWTLVNGSGVVVNEREDVALSPSQTFGVTLTDADLRVADGRQRVFVVDYRYDSDAGNDLRNTAQARFLVEDVMHVD